MHSLMCSILLILASSQVFCNSTQHLMMEFFEDNVLLVGEHKNRLLIMSSDFETNQSSVYQLAQYSHSFIDMSSVIREALSNKWPKLYAFEQFWSWSVRNRRCVIMTLEERSVILIFEHGRHEDKNNSTFKSILFDMEDGKASIHTYNFFHPLYPHLHLHFLISTNEPNVILNLNGKGHLQKYKFNKTDNTFYLVQQYRLCMSNCSKGVCRTIALYGMRSEDRRKCSEVDLPHLLAGYTNGKYIQLFGNVQVYTFEYVKSVAVAYTIRKLDNYIINTNIQHPNECSSNIWKLILVVVVSTCLFVSVIIYVFVFTKRNIDYRQFREDNVTSNHSSSPPFTVSSSTSSSQLPNESSLEKNYKMEFTKLLNRLPKNKKIRKYKSEIGLRDIESSV